MSARDCREAFAKFDLCPRCGEELGRIDHGSVHWMACFSCRLRWRVGANLATPFVELVSAGLMDDELEAGETREGLIERYRRLVPEALQLLEEVPTHVV